MIITPLLLEIRRQANYSVSLFSGIEFNIDFDRSLNGYCDFLISRSPEQLIINAPVAIIVEAKNEDIKSGLGQCAATMLAAKLCNQQENKAINRIYGAVKTGDIWKFLFLEGNELKIDLSNFYIRDVEKILGVLWQAVK